MKKLKDSYNKRIQLRCTVCGMDDKFEFNEDKSYIKCTNCGKEYIGGYDELVEYNQGVIDEKLNTMKEEIVSDLKDEITKSLKDDFKGNKYLKIK